MYWLSDTLFTMNKKNIVLLCLSIALLNLILIPSAHSIMALYYALWILGIGTLIWIKRDTLEVFLQKSKLPPFVTFISLGILMILIEEAMASFFVNFTPAMTLESYGTFLLKFWATNLFTLPGFIIAWYFLLTKFVYSRKEVLVLVGCFGLFAEKIFVHVVTIPLMGVLLILPTMYTYAVIIAPSLLSFPKEKLGQKKLGAFARYTLGFFVPILFSLPFIFSVITLMTKFPEHFYFPQ